MRFFKLTIITSLLILPAVALAKRIPPPKIEPIIYDGIKYVAPNDKGTSAYVEAWDAVTGKRLWKRTVFRTWINPFVEHCIQWVFIQNMRVDNAHLIMVSEKGRTYDLDLKTRRVRNLKVKG
jgi:hypothetical protein